MADTPSLPDGPALIVVGGPTDGEVFPLDKDRSVIVGSGRLANLRLGPTDISSAHIKVTWDDSGLYVTDNASHTGTFVNGEPMETAPLIEGDLITFADPLKQPDWPKLRLYVPPGSVIITAPPPDASPVDETPKAAEPEPAPPPKPRPTPRPKVARTPVGGRAKAPGFAIPGLAGLEPKLAAAAVGGALALVLLVFVLVHFFFGPTPSVASVQPATGEAGISVSLVGDRFASDPAQNIVRFGEATAKVTAGGETSLTVVVPDAAVPGDASLTVQVGRRRSKPAAFRVLKTLRISALDPDVALPGEEVTVKGAGLDNTGLVLTVEGKPAQAFEVQATSLRFRVPVLATDPVRSAPVLLKTKEQVAKPVDLMIGKLPLVLTVTPRTVEAGDRVTLKGRGFAPDPGANRVRIGRASALVLAASPTELVVVAPDLGTAGPAVLTVEAAGRTNSAAVPVQVGAGSSSTYRLRFFAAPAETAGRAFVATVAGPILLLASKDGASSVEERAVKAASALSALADAASSGRPVAVEAGNPPALAVVGGDTILRVTAEDAAAYASPPGVTAAGSSPTPGVLAAHWAALVGDYLAMFARGERPTRLFLTTGRARALLDLQAEVVFRPGSGVAAMRMAQLSAESQQKLREMALLPAAPAQGQAGAAVEGRWEGELQDSDGVTKAVVVELRLKGNALSGTLALGRKVLLQIPLQDLAVRGGSLHFSLRRGGTVHAFEGPIGAGEVAGPLHEGSLQGPTVGRLSLRYVRPPL
jgi:pSer/pThr/pTyr-binding forkhead associated (FHA) protein